jgi:hypothetical protein
MPESFAERLGALLPRHENAISALTFDEAIPQALIDEAAATFGFEVLPSTALQLGLRP